MRSLVMATNLALLLLAGCGDDPELPAAWQGASRLAVRQSSCMSGQPLTAPQPRLELTAGADGVEGTFREAQFRCGPQKVCAYVVESNGAARVLMQPCDMHPSSVPKCTCLYDVSFALPGQEGRATVELYQRPDFYGLSEPPQPRLIDTKPVP